MEVIIMRGLPGSGKTSWINGLGEGTIQVCSADHYHMVGDRYDFKPENASKAHLECKRKFLVVVEQHSMRGMSPNYLIVDNTNTTAWEIAWFWDTATLFGHSPKIVRIHRAFEWCLAHNTHKVPDKVMWQMFQNIQSERLPPHWVEEIVIPKEES